MTYTNFYDEIEKTVFKILARNIGTDNAKNTIGFDDGIIEAITSLESAINDNINYFNGEMED